MKKLIFVLLLIAAFALGWYFISPAFIVLEANEESPVLETSTQNNTKEEPPSLTSKVTSETSVLASADFKEGAHEVKGKVLLIETAKGKVLRFEDFETINGPNLHIYLSSDLNAKDYIDLGEIKATKGNVNYEVPSSVDLSKYNKVLVWCEPFKVLFSYAELE